MHNSVQSLVIQSKQSTKSTSSKLDLFLSKVQKQDSTKKLQFFVTAAARGSLRSESDPYCRAGRGGR